MLKMLSFFTKTCTEIFVALTNYTISDAVLETMPDSNHPLLQFIDSMNFHLADPLPHASLNFVVNRV